MQFRLSNSQRYLVNANPDTNHSANPTHPMVTVNGNPNPTRLLTLLLSTVLSLTT